MDSLKRFVAFMTLICTVLALGAASSDAEGADSIHFYTYVAITNNLGSGLKVTVHCKSADDDLGDQSLDDGQLYKFKFLPNWWETTLFFCSFSWIGGSVEGVVYREKKDIKRCRWWCSWEVTKEGVKGKNRYGVVDIVYKWT